MHDQSKRNNKWANVYFVCAVICVALLAVLKVIAVPRLKNVSWWVITSPLSAPVAASGIIYGGAFLIYLITRLKIAYDYRKIKK